MVNLKFKNAISGKISVEFLLVAVIIFFIIIIGPLDKLSHGYYCDYPEAGAYNTYRELNVNPIVQTFVPKDEHFKGVSVIFTNIIENSGGGYIEVRILDKEDNTLEYQKIELSTVVPGEYTHIYSDAKLEAENIYKLEISARDCEVVPYVLLVNDVQAALESAECYIGNEKIDQNLLLGYGYAQPTFSITEKIFVISILCIAAILLVGNKFSYENKILKQKIVMASTYMFLTLLLAWTYLYNTFDYSNEGFNDFQYTSEALVLGAIVAEHNQVPLEQYGIGTYSSHTTASRNNVFDEYAEKYEYLDIEGYEKGYSLNEPMIVVPENEYTVCTFVSGNFIQFKSGNQYKIESVISDDKDMYITLSANAPLNRYVEGDLSNIKIIQADGTTCFKGDYCGYPSLYGLQGKVFRHIVRYLNYEYALDILHLICCLALAGVVLAICHFIRVKYNTLLSFSFFVTFWLSPWIISFARNLYWVAFTWFLPMLVGLICSIYIKNKKIRRSCYLISFVTIMLKCLCGYEYITTIMLGMIAFLLVDFGKAIFLEDKKMCKLIFTTIFIMGVFAVLGFTVAICMHARIRGEGNILEGIVRIYREDVLRRTLGGTINEFGERYWGALNASVWDVIKKYFHFSTEVLAGIEGDFFPLIAICPIFIMVKEYRKKGYCYVMEDVYLYFITFIASISWFVLGKSHSYIHTHMNFVLWYFGFVQVCLYIITKQTLKYLSSLNKRKTDSL